uniref:Uncharacterized protein n=1 Tax=Heterorhabditis bacteriophora TaxID=37862 RepID=A0A1I7WHD2_HETBA
MNSCNAIGPSSIVVSTPRCGRGDTGSIPVLGISLCCCPIKVPDTVNKRSALCILTQRPPLGPHLCEYDICRNSINIFTFQIDNYVKLIGYNISVSKIQMEIGR